MNECTLTARWILPVDCPPLASGTITWADDRIVAVEPQGTRRPDMDLGNCAILPGFVNAHTHLDLTGARGKCPPTPDFTQWLRTVIAFRLTRSPAEVQADIATGLAECIRSGTTLIGDIAAGGASWTRVANAPCRARIFYELLGLSETRAEQSWREVEAWWRQHPSQDLCCAGLSPHAPYSVRRSLYERAAGATSLPIATHLAESSIEVELLRSRSGPFVDFLKEMQVWDPTGLIADPMELIRKLPRGIFVHGNYLDPTTPFLTTQSLVICPRTHAAFGHPRHPFPNMRVRVALGTDSLASNPDLDILSEARFLRQQFPEVPPASIVRMLTLHGAEALGFGDIAGSLTPGKSADLVVLPIPNEDRRDPHELILDGAGGVERVLFHGEWSVLP